MPPRKKLARGCLGCLGIFVLLAVVLIPLLYLEEDWRGAREWAATKAKWEARGETFDLNRFTPLPVPGENNLAALPLFKTTEKQTKGGSVYEELDDFRRATFSNVPQPLPGVPVLGSWQSGKLTDMIRFRQAVASNYAALFKGQPLASDPLAQFDAIYPFTADLRAAAATRNLFRLDVKYDVTPPAARALGPFTDMIQLAKIMTEHAVLALDERQPQEALDDLKVDVIVAQGAKDDPTLVGGLVAIGIMAISESAIYHGLAEHEWNDAQLAQLEQMVGSVHLLVTYQFVMRAEAADVVTNIEYFKPISRWKPEILGIQSTLARRSPVFWPGGWWDNNSRLVADFLFAEVATVDPEKGLVFPSKADELADHAKRAAWWPWSFWYAMSAPVMSESSSKFAQAQVWADETRIACALERFRLSRGVYPSTLALVAGNYFDDPPNTNKMPHDIMNGQDYHYRLNGDGTYLLYSVGWNQRDDGGVEALEPETTEARDYSRGDWVWPMVKR